MTLTRKGPVPPWYGWASLLCLCLLAVLPRLLRPLGDVGRYGAFALFFILICCFALSINYALHAITDSEQRRLGVITLSIYISLWLFQLIFGLST